MKKLQDYSANWKRAIFVDSPIDDDLIRRLAPAILTMRQESAAPITVGIDSPGGSLASLSVLLELLRGPDQNNRTGHIVAVATGRAYSAAANLLALADYSVALGHSRIVFHDVRYGELDDVTPQRARDAAKSLQDKNDELALRLADRIIERLVWIYIDLQPSFEEDSQEFPPIHKAHSEIISYYAQSSDDNHVVDLAGFATTLWARLSPDNDQLIAQVMTRLGAWTDVTRLVESAPAYSAKDSRVPGMLDGSRHLLRSFGGKAGNFKSTEGDLKLLLSLLVAQIALAKKEEADFNLLLERGTREFGWMRSMNDPMHVERASDLLREYHYMFLSRTFRATLKGKSKGEREAIINKKIAPHVRLLWLFCVQLCRELFEGEHVLAPSDAQLLGLVDEVCGGGPVNSLREFGIEHAKARRKGG